MVNDQKLLELVRNADPKLAQTLSDIITNKIVSSIHCMSKHCKGRVIGYILSNGEPKEELSKGSGMLSMRKRFDGEYGFECICGQDSRKSEHEKGILGAGKPSKEDLREIWERINKKPTIAKQHMLGKEVDGFLIEEYK